MTSSETIDAVLEVKNLTRLRKRCVSVGSRDNTNECKNVYYQYRRKKVRERWKKEFTFCCSDCLAIERRRVKERERDDRNEGLCTKTSIVLIVSRNMYVSLSSSTTLLTPVCIREMWLMEYGDFSTTTTTTTTATTNNRPVFSIHM